MWGLDSGAVFKGTVTHVDDGGFVSSVKQTKKRPLYCVNKTHAHARVRTHMQLIFLRPKCWAVCSAYIVIRRRKVHKRVFVLRSNLSAPTCATNALWSTVVHDKLASSLRSDVVCVSSSSVIVMYIYCLHNDLPGLSVHDFAEGASRDLCVRVVRH